MMSLMLHTFVQKVCFANHQNYKQEQVYQFDQLLILLFLEGYHSLIVISNQHPLRHTEWGILAKVFPVQI